MVHVPKEVERAVAKASVLAAAIAALLCEQAAAQGAPLQVSERCYGIARKGLNDCGTHLHACAGQATRDKDPAEWIQVPKGTCVKIAGGSLRPPAVPAQPAKAK